jgi:hypothetical protein
MGVDRLHAVVDLLQRHFGQTVAGLDGHALLLMD